MTKKPLTGLLPACPSALTPEGKADKPAMIALARHILDNGASGLVPLGGTGEYTSLLPEVRIETVEACVEAADGAPVYAGVLAPGLGDAIPAARAFKAAGADGIMLMLPYYMKLTQQGVIDYFHAMRDAVDLPIMFYDIPARSHFVTSTDTIAALAEDGTINSIKASNTDIAAFDRLVQTTPESFSVLSGQDTLFAQEVALGAVGGVLTTAVVVPSMWAEIQALASAGKMEEGLRIQRQLEPLMSALFCEENPVPLRYALQTLGLETGPSPAPLQPISDAAKARVDAALADLRNAGAPLPKG